MFSFNSDYCTLSKERWLMEFLRKIDLEALFKQMEETKKYREAYPDWDRPVVMYGIRKKHKCIKKQEIAVVIDMVPTMNRARMAENHWYKILYKRPATDLEWEEMKAQKSNRRYCRYPYYIMKGWTIDKIISHIVQDDSQEYELDTTDLIHAFENYYGRKIRIYRRETAIQLDLFQ